jgi:hypothetical protein
MKNKTVYEVRCNVFYREYNEEDIHVDSIWTTEAEAIEAANRIADVEDTFSFVEKLHRKESMIWIRVYEKNADGTESYDWEAVF